MLNMKEDYKNKEKSTLVYEKNELEQTLKTLSAEVEELSETNETFLQGLRQKDYYLDFKTANEELNQLRDAHILLINLIENQDLQINLDGANSKFYKDNQKFSPAYRMSHQRTEIRNGFSDHKESPMKNSFGIPEITTDSPEMKQRKPKSGFKQFFVCGADQTTETQEAYMDVTEAKKLKNSVEFFKNAQVISRATL